MPSLLVIDIGSRSIKGTLVDAQTRQMYQVLKFDATLGNHLTSTNQLEQVGIQKLLHSVNLIIRDAEERAKALDILPMDIYCFGTAALRKATNQIDIKKQFYNKFKINLHIITGEQEAEYERIAVLNAPVMLANPNKKAVFIDMGGNSTELSLISEKADCIKSVSLNFGVNVLSKRPQHEIESSLLDYFKEIALDVRNFAPELVVVGGSTITTYVHECLIASGNFDADLVESRCIDENCEVADGGAKANIGRCLLKAVRQMTEAPVYVTTYGARHGIIYASLRKGDLQTSDL